MRAERSTDRDSQYVSLASSDALITAGWKRQSPRRNSDDNALGETVNGLYKATLIYSKRICEPASEIELATLNWVHWWNTSRLYEALGYRSPTAVEAACTPPPRDDGARDRLATEHTQGASRSRPTAGGARLLGLTIIQRVYCGGGSLRQRRLP